jgi:hypothetical protein
VKSLALIAGILLAGVAQAAVADSSATGFTVKLSVTVQGSAVNAYRKFVDNVGDWWSPDHTFSNDPHHLNIEEKPGGCFCEELADGGGVRHLEIVNFMPGKYLIMSGGMGPLQSLAAAGTLSIQFAPVKEGTRVDLVYALSGYLPTGMNTWAAPVDGMLTETLTRFKNYVDLGDPAPKK